MTPSPPIDSALPARRPLRLAHLVLGLALGVAILLIAGFLMGVRRAELIDALVQAPLWASPASAVALFVLFAAGALRWNRSIQPLLHNTFWQGYWAMLVTYPLNSVLPAKAGDLYRVNLLALRTGASRATILGAEIMDKGMDLSGPLPLIGLLLLFGHPPGWVASGAALMGSVLALIALFILVTRGRAPSRRTWLSRSMGSLREAYTQRSARELLVTALLIAPLPWLGESAALYLIASGFGLPLTLVQAFCLLVAIKVGMVVPTPGGIGSVEAAGAAALVFFGAAPAQAFALMLIYRTSQLAAGSLIGAVFLANPIPFGRRLAAEPAE